MLVQKKNPKTNKTEYCLVSARTPGKVLEWFGAKRPSEARVDKAEARVQYFDHKGKK